MAEGFQFLYHDVNGVELDPPRARDGSPTSVLPVRVITDIHVEQVGPAAAFELDAARPSRGGSWSGLSGAVEILSPRQSDELELLIVRCGDAYRVLRPTAVDDDRLVYRLPVSPGPSVDRGPFGVAMRWIIQKVVMPSVGDMAASTGARLIEHWESARRPSAMRSFTTARYQSPRADALDRSELRAGRVLLLLHGVNAQSHDRNSFGGMPAALVDRLNGSYEHVIAWDHPTLTVSPDVTAQQLRSWFGDDAKGRTLDIVGHGFGGIVARWLVEHHADDLDIGSVVFVGTPHQGTELADPAHIGGFVDRLLTMAFAIPDNPVSMAVEGALTIAKEMVAGVAEQLDGIAGMKPGSAMLDALGAPPAESGVPYRVITSDFEAAPGSGLWHAIKDGAADMVFGGAPNDLVVPMLSALQLGQTPGEGFADMVVFDDDDMVSHARYFSHRLVQPVLSAWLQRSPGRLPAGVASRSRTPDDVRAMVQLGAQWTVAQRVTDLVCLAPVAARPGLQKAVEGLRARAWSALTGRGERSERSTVVLVPGIMGSELCGDDGPIWLSPWRLAQGAFRRLRLDGDAVDPSIRATEMLCFAYRRLLDHTRITHDVVEFPYDWRRSVDDAAAELVEVLRRLVADPDRREGEPIHLVAHSTGGLVVRRARQLAASGRAAANPFPRLEPGRIVLLGTPNRGSFGAPLALLGRHPLVANLARLDVGQSRADWLDAMWTFPGLLQMLPDPDGIGDGSEARFEWLYDLGRWPARELVDATRRMLDAARSWHDELRADEGDGLHVVLGDGLQTPVGIRPVGPDRFEVEIGPRGDGTVATASGRLARATVHYAPGVSHAELVRDPKVLRAVDEILERGSTRLLRPDHAETRRDGSTSGAGAGSGPTLWLSPDDAELELDGRAGASRDGLGPVLRPPAWTRRDVLVAALDAVATMLPRPTTADTPDLRITVVHGSLEHAAHPIMVGHGTGTPIAGAEARCDELLGCRLTSLNILGGYPDVRGTHLYVPQVRPSDRLHGCIIVALDSTAPLSAGELAEHISGAVVDFVERRYWEHLKERGNEPAPTSLGLSAVPVGSGPGLGLPLDRSIDAVVTGVQRANTVLASQDRPVIGALEFIERYADKVERMMEALRRAQQRVNAAPHRLGRIDLGTGQIVQRDGRLSGTPPPSYEGGRWERLSIEVVDPPSDVAAGSPITHLRYRFAHDRAAVTERPRRVDRKVVGELLDEAVRRPARCAALGAVLFEELLPAELKDELGRVDNLVLQLDEQGADIPWELLVDRFAGHEPLACRAGLLRQFRTNDLRPRPRASVALSALVLGDPPTEFSRLPGARREASDVWQLMRGRSVEAQLLQFDDVDQQDGRSSAARVKEAFRARDHRIIHIAAHGLYRVSGDGLEGGVAIGDDALLTADDFANLRIAPDLVFLNCCHLGRLRAGGDAVGNGVLGPVEQHLAAASIAKRLMDIGVKAVVVAGWAVGDEQAHLFATEFYREMLDGRPYGDAVREARQVVFRQFEQSDNSWAAYQCYGDPGFQLATPTQRSFTLTALPLRAAASRQLDELFLRAGEAADLDPLRRELEALDAEVARQWPRDGELLTQCGQLWADLGGFEEAIDRYEQAVSSGGGAPILAVEQLVNISARQAARRRARPVAGDPPRGVQESLRRAKRWARVLERLGGTSERRSIAASLAKRCAYLEPRHFAKHLETAITAYAASACRACEESAPDQRDLYGFRNAIQLASLFDDDQVVNAAVEELISDDWLTRWSDDLVNRDPTGGFWQQVGPPDSALAAAFVRPGSMLATRITTQLNGSDAPGADRLRTLVKSTVEEQCAEIAEGYVRTRPGSRVREWSTVLEHLEVMGALATQAAHPDAATLGLLGEMLAAASEA